MLCSARLQRRQGMRIMRNIQPRYIARTRFSQVSKNKNIDLPYGTVTLQWSIKKLPKGNNPSKIASKEWACWCPMWDGTVESISRWRWIVVLRKIMLAALLGLSGGGRILHRGRERDRDRTWRRDFSPSIGWSWYYIESVHVNKQALSHLVPAVQRDGSWSAYFQLCSYGSLSHFDLVFFSSIGAARLPRDQKKITDTSTYMQHTTSHVWLGSRRT